jgi:hypothetical protein
MRCSPGLGRSSWPSSHRWTLPRLPAFPCSRMPLRISVSTTASVAATVAVVPSMMLMGAMAPSDTPACASFFELSAHGQEVAYNRPRFQRFA